MEALDITLCHLGSKKEREGGGQKGEAQRAKLCGNLKTLGKCLHEDRGCWCGQEQRQVLLFASKALLSVSFQLNVTGLYCSMRNTCVNIP